MKKIEWTLPIKILSEANNTDHWTKKRKRITLQHKWIWHTWNNSQQDIQMPCLIILTRIAPRELDYDNLVHAFKHIRDAVANICYPGLAPGQADSKKDLSWEYKQEKGSPKEYAVKIEIISL